MNAAEWTDWGNSVKAFASANGCILEKLVVSESQEGDMNYAFLTDGASNGDIELKEKDASLTLCGIPVMFTKKLESGRALFVLKDGGE